MALQGRSSLLFFKSKVIMGSIKASSLFLDQYKSTNRNKINPGKGGVEECFPFTTSSAGPDGLR